MPIAPTEEQTTGNRTVVNLVSRLVFVSWNVLLFPRNDVLLWRSSCKVHMHANECKNSLTLTPSACACRPGALRPCVLTPGVDAGCGLGAGVVRTCVFPELCKLLDDRTLPMLPTLPLRSPPPRRTHTHYSIIQRTSLRYILSHC